MIFYCYLLCTCNICITSTRILRRYTTSMIYLLSHLFSSFNDTQFIEVVNTPRCKIIKCVFSVFIFHISISFTCHFHVYIEKKPNMAHMHLLVISVSIECAEITSMRTLVLTAINLFIVVWTFQEEVNSVNHILIYFIYIAFNDLLLNTYLALIPAYHTKKNLLQFWQFQTVTMRSFEIVFLALVLQPAALKKVSRMGIHRETVSA
jgi:hypothetical protein